MHLRGVFLCVWCFPFSFSSKNFQNFFLVSSLTHSSCSNVLFNLNEFVYLLFFSVDFKHYCGQVIDAELFQFV